jgi:hypothetical protein
MATIGMLFTALNLFANNNHAMLFINGYVAFAGNTACSASQGNSRIIFIQVTKLKQIG